MCVKFHPADLGAGPLSRLQQMGFLMKRCWNDEDDRAAKRCRAKTKQKAEHVGPREEVVKKQVAAWSYGTCRIKIVERTELRVSLTGPSTWHVGQLLVEPTDG